MAIEGPLRELGLTDLFQLIHLSRKTGTLTVRAASYPRPALVHFDRGAVVGTRAAGDSTRLGQLLLRAGKASEGQIQRALQEQHAEPSLRLGAILVRSGGIAREDVESQLRFQMEESIFQLVQWTDGHFRFEESAPPDVGPIAIRVATEGVLMEALRRVDEWSALASGPPDTDLVPGLVEGGGPRTLSLQPLEWEVLAAVDGEHSLRSIARVLGQAEFEVAKAVFALVSVGLVDLRHRQPRPAAPSPAAPPPPPELVAAEAELSAGRLDAAERRAREALQRDGGRAELHLLLGRVELRRSRWAQAAQHLHAAVQRDPLLARAYYALGLAAARQGDLPRAAEALDTYLRLPEGSTERRDRAVRAASLIAELQRLLDEDGDFKPGTT